MWLINNASLKLEWFVGTGGVTPPYAILSHTWGDGEVTLGMLARLDETIKSMKGFLKISKTCALALAEGIQYSWVDTCCIDKTSSAELTEAINSMFQYYRDAVVCYAWLEDLPAVTDEVPTREDLELCRWFTRGWTLQELIAPFKVNFYDASWTFRGTKSDLSDVLAQITGISTNVLRDPDTLFNLSVAQRMSWVASRQTTRIEDMAYCLLGVFDVNMPMLYGEGTKAFLRLQEEIARSNNDLSLFAWKAASNGQKYHGVFANSPADFGGCSSVENVQDTAFNPEFSMTNKGIRLTHDILRGENEAYLMMLRCTLLRGATREPIGIWIQQHGGGVYGRTQADQYGITPPGETGTSKQLYLAKRIAATRSSVLERSTANAFKFRHGFNEAIVPAYDPTSQFEGIHFSPHDEWDSLRRMFLTHGASEFTGYAQFMLRKGLEPQKVKVNGAETFYIIFGVTEGESKPWITMANARLGKAFLDAISNLNDKTALANSARELNLKELNLKNDMMEDAQVISVALEEELVDGQSMYCIDIFAEDLEVIYQGLDGLADLHGVYNTGEDEGVNSDDDLDNFSGGLFD